MWSFLWLFVLEAVVIIATNVTTIVIFARTRRLHSKQYIMIISQAVADLFVGLVSVPMFTARLALKIPTLSLFTHAFYFQDSFFGVASIFGLAALAIERAHATYFPFRHATLGKRPYIIGIVLMWTVPFLVVVPYFFPVDANLSIIKIRTKIKATFNFLTLFIIIGAYFLIFLKVRCTTTPAHDVTIQENKRLTVTLAVVTALSLVMWLPLQCVLLAGPKYIDNSPLVYYTVLFLKYGNSFVNSVVYAFRMREIKREILRVFQCCRSNQVVSVNNETELVNT